MHSLKSSTYYEAPHSLVLLEDGSVRLKSPTEFTKHRNQQGYFLENLIL
jgi:hypothetical protein